MFFHQDDIGMLIQMHSIPFLHFLFTPSAQQLVPIQFLIWTLFYKLFYLNIYPYLIFNWFIHGLNCVFLVKILDELLGKNKKLKVFKVFMAALFIVNVTYTEVFQTLNGSPVALLFLALGFLAWLRFMRLQIQKYYWYSLIAIIFSGLSYNFGIGVGLIFAIVTTIYSKISEKNIRPSAIIGYLLVGSISYIAGPLLSTTQAKGFFPEVANPIQFLLVYGGFIIVGIGRGVVGRLFLPGFEPPNENLLGTIVSFIPFVGIGLYTIQRIVRWRRDESGKKENTVHSLFLFIVSIFTLYPYIWAGFIRSHFGLKQALAERYAYPSIFFFIILLGLLIAPLWMKWAEKIKLHFIIGIVALIFFQWTSYHAKAIEYAIRQKKERDYILTVEKVLSHTPVLLDLPLPSYINQTYFTLGDLLVIYDRSTTPKILPVSVKSCTNTLIHSIESPLVMRFYQEQFQDPLIQKQIDVQKLNRCFESARM